MQTITGVLEDINARSVTTKYGEKTAYNVVISGQKYGHGFKSVPFAVGTQVSGTVERNGDYLNISALTLAGNADAPVANTAPASSPVAASAPASKPTGTNWDKKDRQIVRQNALTQANKMFETLIRSGAELEIGAETIIEEAEKFASWVLKHD
jgi:hypothetical protein